MKCLRCQHDNPAGTKFCGQCAAPLTSICATCGAANPPNNKFCGQCAAPLREAMAPKFATPDSYASPGSILMTPSTLAFVEGFVAAKPLGPVPHLTRGSVASARLTP